MDRFFAERSLARGELEFCDLGSSAWVLSLYFWRVCEKSQDAAMGSGMVFDHGRDLFCLGLFPGQELIRGLHFDLKAGALRGSEGFGQQWLASDRHSVWS